MYTKEDFPNQKEGEVIVMFLRRHWIAVAKIIVISIVLALLPVISYYMVFSTSTVDLFSPALANALALLIGSSYYLFLCLLWFMMFIDYYLDVWIVTNMRIINIEQRGLFNRTVSEKDLGRMQDVTSEVKGIWETIFNYGRVYIQTAGEEQRFIFKQVPDAHKVARDISNMVEEYKKRYGFYYEDDIDFDDAGPRPKPRIPDQPPHYHSY